MSAPEITSPAHRYMRYEWSGSNWRPTSDSNLSEIIHRVITAGRTCSYGQKPFYNFKEQLPIAYEVYSRIEQEYQKKMKNLRAHTWHTLTNEEYVKILDEVWAIIEKDPCDRAWLVY